MLRTFLACCLLSFCLADTASAEARLSSDENCDVLVSMAPPAVPLSPVLPRTAWCESPEDPRCTPAAPAPGMALTAWGLPLAIAPTSTPTVAPPRIAEAEPASTTLLGPSAEVRNRIERPPSA